MAAVRLGVIFANDNAAITKKLVMIIDTLENAGKYFSVHPSFKQAFEFIYSTDIASADAGKIDIDADKLKAIFSNKQGMTIDESISKFECHNNHIDIQLCIDGAETIGWKPRQSCTQQKGEYNRDKDVLFFEDTPDMYFQLTNGQFVIFFPEDVHAPMIGDSTIKKLVIKVKIEV